PRRGRHCHQGLWPDASRPQWRRTVARKAIFAEIDNSLRRLGMDYVDLYQIHRFDHDTPIEETLEALHDVVKAGRSALYRRLVDARLAVRPRASHRREQPLDPLRPPAEPRPSPLSRGAARNAAAVPGGG